MAALHVETRDARVKSMSPRVSLGRWTLRDWRMSSIVLVGIPIILVVLIYSFSGVARPWLQGALGLHIGGGAGQSQSQGSGEDGEAKHYLGSIIVSPRRGDKCLERGLDNRNGAMWDKGYVDCDVIPPLKALEDQAKGLAARRLKAIGRAFTPNNND